MEITRTQSRSTNGADPAGLPLADSLPPTTLSARPSPRPRLRPMQSLVASARRITSRTISGGSFKRSYAADWQDDAWDMYDLVGEQRFLATTLSGQLSKARLYVGRLADDDTEDPEPVEDERLRGILDAVGGSPVGRAQLIYRLGVNLFVPGDAWLCGIPKRMLRDTGIRVEEDEEGELIDLTGYDVTAGTGTLLIDDLDEDTIQDLEWRVLSVSEVSFLDRKVRLQLGSDAMMDIVEAPLDDVYLIRVWRPHPRRSWEADSPTRSSLPVLRELVGLTMHISAQVDSRLAGAGVFLVPESAVRAMKTRMGLEEDSDEDPFTDALLEAMLKPIGDRANASALVPLVITAPDESLQLANAFKHVTFDKPLDIEARNLRDEAIRRLALGEDAPPELLLGAASTSNHWGAWLVMEDVVTTHLEPPLALICDALTSQYLHPVMRGMGWPPDTIDEYVIWYDVDHMIVRPNRSSDALSLHERGAIGSKALRDALGFDDADAPEQDPSVAAGTPGIGTPGTTTRVADEAALKAIDIVLAMPQLMVSPGLDAIVAQVRHALYGDPIPSALPTEITSTDIATPVPDSLPDTADDVPDLVASASMYSARTTTTP